jgi:3-hydroxy-9,10-secoandrosta-1,3,5(10)-triene-9,17-dione monooxygenase
LPGCLGEDNAVITASSYPPFGKVEEVEGGFNISGTWKTSSGCDHSQWAFLGGLRRDASGQVIDRLSMLVPSCAWVIEDDWHTFGLAGTGSKSLVIKHAFVPHHRAHSLIQYTYSERPANYLYPFNQIFFGAVSALIVGIAQGGIDEYVRQMSVRTNTTDGAGAALRPYVKDRLGNAVVRAFCPCAAAANACREQRLCRAARTGASL